MHCMAKVKVLSINWVGIGVVYIIRGEFYNENA